MQNQRASKFTYLTLVLLISFVTSFAHSQTSFPTVFPKPVLVIDQERLFNESSFGLAIVELEARNKAVLIEASGVIARAFEAEELKLTELRSEMTADEFQVLSDDFNTRVQTAREEQINNDIADSKANEERRRGFFTQVAPFLAAILQKYSASAILDQRSVLLFSRDLDITQEAIERIDLAFNENPGLLEE